VLVGGGWEEGKYSSDILDDSEINVLSVLVGDSSVILPGGWIVGVVELLFGDEYVDRLSILAGNSSIIMRHDYYR